ncbi:MAG: protein yceI precursor [Deltaproteobacteria bacterium]|nr:MAG: protein yceI precursor [Deltaproteobacteria bacterium]
MFTFKRLFIITLLLMIPHLALAASWKIDPAHTTVEFKIRHLMISWVKGVFTNVEGTVVINEADLTRSNVKIQIATPSIDTNNKKRDDHLRSPEFFDVATYPIMTFVSKEVIIANEQPVEIVGDLTIRDVTREVTLEVEDFSQAVTDPWGNTRRGATSSTKINRKDYGLTWSKTLETGGVVVGDEVRISLEVEMIKE